MIRSSDFYNRKGEEGVAASFLFLHHFAHALPPFAVGDVEEVDARGQTGHADFLCAVRGFH